MTLSYFMKKNKAVKENVKYVATKSLKDENGNPLEWEIKHLSTKENEKLRNECTTEVFAKDKSGLIYPKFETNKYLAKLATASVVFPDLLNAELQDSYGVKTPEDLLMEIVDNPGEYTDFVTYIQELSGFDETLEEKIDTAKN